MNAEDGILDFHDLKQLKNVEWAIPRLLMKRSMSILHAPQGHMKSLLAIHLGHVQAYGLSFGVDTPPVPRGLVLYLAFEGLDGMPQRREAAMRHMKLPATDLDAFKVINPLDHEVAGVKGIGLDLLSADSTFKFIKLAMRLSHEHKLPIAGVVTDVLQVAVGYQETTKTFKSYAENGRRIVDMLDTHFMTLAHNKADSKRSRGPGILVGAAETVLSLERDGLNLFMTSTKQRESDSDVRYHFIAHKITLGFDEETELPVTSVGLTFEGIVEGDTSKTKSSSHLYQIASMMRPGTKLSVTAVVKLVGWSTDGKGGRQHAQVLEAVPEVPRSIHVGNDDYRLIWREPTDGGGWTIHCMAAPKEEPTGEPISSEPTGVYKPPKAIKTARVGGGEVPSVVPQKTKLPEPSESIPPPPPSITEADRKGTQELWRSILPRQADEDQPQAAEPVPDTDPDHDPDPEPLTDGCAVAPVTDDAPSKPTTDAVISAATVTPGDPVVDSADMPKQSQRETPDRASAISSMARTDDTAPPTGGSAAVTNDAHSTAVIPIAIAPTKTAKPLVVVAAAPADELRRGRKRLPVTTTKKLKIRAARALKVVFDDPAPLTCARIKAAVDPLWESLDTENFEADWRAAFRRHVVNRLWATVTDQTFKLDDVEMAWWASGDKRDPHVLTWDEADGFRVRDVDLDAHPDDPDDGGGSGNTRTASLDSPGEAQAGAASVGDPKPEMPPSVLRDSELTDEAGAAVPGSTGGSAGGAAETIAGTSSNDLALDRLRDGCLGRVTLFEAEAYRTQIEESVARHGLTKLVGDAEAVTLAGAYRTRFYNRIDELESVSGAAVITEALQAIDAAKRIPDVSWWIEHGAKSPTDILEQAEIWVANWHAANDGYSNG